MARFSATRDGAVVRVAFDDGGMNLLSANALRELRETIAAVQRGAFAAPEPRAGDDGERSQVTSAQPNEDEGSFTALRRSAPPPEHAAPPVQDDIRLLVFHSARPRLFAAGADMAEMRRFHADDAATFAALGQQTFAAIARLPFVTAALIDGDCFGGALDLALAFDLRLATPRSRFSHPGAKLGIVTGFGGTARWRRTMDPRAATSLFLGNETLNAADAAKIGLVDAVAESFDDHLRQLAGVDPRTVVLVKELARHAPRLSRSELLLLAERLGKVYTPN